eukprot:7187154-Pyramimonas_sp.AAC.2
MAVWTPQNAVRRRGRPKTQWTDSVSTFLCNSEGRTLAQAFHEFSRLKWSMVESKCVEYMNS